MIRLDMISLFAIIGSVNAMLAAIVIWIRFGKSLSNRLLSLLLIATSIRIAKNIVVHARSIDPDVQMSAETWRFLVNFGISHQFAIGPLFLLYVQSRLSDNFKLTKTHWLHFIPYVGLVLASYSIEWSFWKYGGLWASYISILAYYLISLFVHVRSLDKFSRIDHSSSRWLSALMIFAGILLIAYSPALFKYIGYIGGAFLYATGIFFILYIMSVNNKIKPLFFKKYQNSKISNGDQVKLFKKLKELMSDEKCYQDPDLTLNSLAGKLEVNHAQLSRTINQLTNMGFSQYVNQLRIRDAQEYLSNPDKSHLKIAAIAFDCGFNAVSTFNGKFKEMTGMTPRQYRDEQLALPVSNLSQ